MSDTQPLTYRVPIGIHVEPGLWDRFIDACNDRGADPDETINAFLLLYVEGIDLDEPTAEPVIT
jgi:hypothetical protein